MGKISLSVKLNSLCFVSVAQMKHVLVKNVLIFLGGL